MQQKKGILETGDRLLRLLDCFTEENPEWGITELSKELELNKSIVYRMVVTLENRGFLKQNLVNKKYSLGLKLFELGMVVSRQMDLRNAATPVLNDLSRKVDETVVLEIVDDLNGMCIGIKESSQSIKSTSQLGKRVPLYTGAPTKVLMAYLDNDEIDRIINSGLKRFTPNTTTDPCELKTQLQLIRQQGFSISYGELDLGSTAVAFPIKDYKGEVIASIAIIGPEFRMKDRLEEYTQLCKKAAYDISTELGFKGK